MRDRNELGCPYRQFSEKAEKAISEGRISAAPLVSTLERAHAAANGIRAVMTIVIANDVLREAPDEDCPQKPLPADIIWDLQRLARVTSEMLAREIDDLAEWAEKRCAKGDE